MRMDFFLTDEEKKKMFCDYMNGRYEISQYIEPYMIEVIDEVFTVNFDAVKPEDEDERE